MGRWRDSGMGRVEWGGGEIVEWGGGEIVEWGGGEIVEWGGGRRRCNLLKIIIITVTADRLNESVSYLEMCNG